MGSTKNEITAMATRLGLSVSKAHTPTSIKTEVDRRIKEIFGQKGIGANTTVQYDSNAPRSIAGKKVTLKTGAVVWDGFYPQVESVEGHTYGAHTVALHATVVK